MSSYYSTGTVTLVAGSKAVAGNGTAWQTALVSGGNIIVEAAGNVLPIASVVADNLITAELAWSGASGTYPYAIQRDTAYLKSLDANSQNLAYLLAELRRGTIFKYDVAGPLAGRAVYDRRPEGFAYLATDAGAAGEEDSSKLYVKLSTTAGDWAGPFAYGAGPKGVQGDPGLYRNIIAGNVQTLPAGQVATASMVAVDPGTVRLDLGIPKGQDGAGDLVGPAGARDGWPLAFDGSSGKKAKELAGAVALLHSLVPAAGKFPYFSAQNAAALADLSTFARSVLDDANGAAMFATMGASLVGTASAGTLIFPNGWMINFGQSSNGDQTTPFATAFPSALLAHGATAMNANTAATEMLSIQASQVTGSGITWRPRYGYASGVGMATQNFKWWALGY